jgi:hypothetical protein
VRAESDTQQEAQTQRKKQKRKEHEKKSARTHTPTQFKLTVIKIKQESSNLERRCLKKMQLLSLSLSRFLSISSL